MYESSPGPVPLSRARFPGARNTANAVPAESVASSTVPKSAAAAADGAATVQDRLACGLQIGDGIAAEHALAAVDAEDPDALRGVGDLMGRGPRVLLGSGIEALP